ncbi:MAG TPA: serine/threonine-protein kinase [Kofleriaceae bacterium]|nr:serine/threonine-protein kinase [Kofleriaceae bacterium]
MGVADRPGAGQAPARLGRYELIARLAAGGMGEIFLARMEGAAGFEKLYAIKRILPHLADDERFRVMLIDEARVAARMTHANVCHVYELGETDGQLYIVMEYLEGTTVLPLLRKRSREAAPLDLGFVAGVIQQTSDGLHYAHELKDRAGGSLGIVHRDVTPSNLFITDAGMVKVLDFGIAKVKRESKQTQTGMVKGKYAYMSPEQLRGGEVDRRSDVFALGVVTYEMLALRRLFQRKTDYLTFHAVMEQPIIDVRRYRPDCPDALAGVLRTALDRDPARRFATARQFGAAVVDAIRPARAPWGQGELADFIATQFSDELRRRSEHIATVVATGAKAMTMAMFAAGDATLVEGVDDEDGEFPAVDSAIIEAPDDAAHLRGETGERAAYRVPTAELEARRQASELRAAAFAEGTPSAEAQALPGPMPRAGLATAATVIGVPAVPSAVAPPRVIEAAPAPVAPPIVVVQPRRSVVWPAIAGAMVVIAAGALVLLWQRQQQAPPPLPPIEIQPAPAAPPAPIAAPAPGPEPTPTLAPASPSPSPPTRPGPTKPPAAPRDPYARVVLAKQDEVNRCIGENDPPPANTRLQIIVAPDGHPRDITFDPASVGGTALGACIKNVFRSVVFPHADKDRLVPVTLSHRA